MRYFAIILITLFSLTMTVCITSCNPNDDGIDIPEITPIPDSTPNPIPDTEPPILGNQAVLVVGSVNFTIAFQDNPTANAFKQMLPMTISMIELNNNEKYYRLPNSLPTNSANPGTIQNGDLMLYDSNTIVLFYETFSTSYSYTRVGRVNNPSGLKATLGTNNVVITLKMQE
jgi:hypothetical protein